MAKRLAKFGFHAQDVERMIRREGGQKRTTPFDRSMVVRQPRYPKVHCNHLSVETLTYLNIPYKYDEVSASHRKAGRRTFPVNQYLRSPEANYNSSMIAITSSSCRRWMSRLQMHCLRIRNGYERRNYGLNLPNPSHDIHGLERRPRAERKSCKHVW